MRQGTGRPYETDAADAVPEVSRDARAARGTGAFLVIGDTPVARRVCATLADVDRENRVLHLAAPGDADLSVALSEPIDSAAVLIRDDVAALRYALALAHLAPALRLTVTIFDRTIASQLRLFLPEAWVVSPASLAVPSLAGPCLSADVIAAFMEGGERVEVRRQPGASGLTENSIVVPAAGFGTRVVKSLRLNPRHHDAGTRILLIGLLGLGAILVADWGWLFLLEGHSPGESFLDAARVVATVGPGAVDVATAYGIFSAIAMLATIVLTALFTAGLVDRLLEPRLIRLVGPRTVPNRDHVIVVGMGQVGVRLCQELADQGIPVVGVERDKHAVGVRLARQLGIPVLIGDGTERSLLERLGVPHCLALAAVGSDDLDNIAVAVATAAVSPSTRVVLRAGEQEAVAETRALMPLGVIRDVTEMGATFVVATLLGCEVQTVVADGDSVSLRARPGRYASFPVSRKEECLHATARNEVAQ